MSAFPLNKGSLCICFVLFVKQNVKQRDFLTNTWKWHTSFTVYSQDNVVLLGFILTQLEVKCLLCLFLPQRDTHKFAISFAYIQRHSWSSCRLTNINLKAFAKLTVTKRHYTVIFTRCKNMYLCDYPHETKDICLLWDVFQLNNRTVQIHSWCVNGNFWQIL